MNKKVKEYSLYFIELGTFDNLREELEAYNYEDFPDADWKGITKDLRSINEKINGLLNSMVEK